MGRGSDLVSRWATGERKPAPLDRALLEEKFGINWLDWEHPVDEAAPEPANDSPPKNGTDNS